MAKYFKQFIVLSSRVWRCIHSSKFIVFSSRVWRCIHSSKFIVLLSLLLFSCQEGGDAGDLFGQWRLQDSDSKYISFSGSVVWIKELLHGEATGTFQHQGDSLFMQCRSIKGMPEDTIIIEQSFGFRPIDNIRVKITTLDSDHLVLTKDGQTWSFYKY